MNYTQYLQGGGETPQFTEEQTEMIKAMQPYGEAFKQSPGGTIQAAANDLHFDVGSSQAINDFLTGLLSYAQLIGDKNLELDIQKFVESDEGKNLLSEEPMFKCGGRVRAKVKKACGGLKAKTLEKGDKIKKVGAGCPCQWKKVGGRLIEVDCNGIPVAKNGAVMKFETPAGTLPAVTFGKNKNGVNTYTVDGRTYTGYSGTFSDQNGTAPVSYMNLLRDAEKWANSTNGSAYKQMAGNVYSKFGTDRLYGKVVKDGKTYYYSNLGASDAKWNNDTNLWEREGYTYTPYKMQNGQDSFKWVKNASQELPEVEVVDKPTKSAGQLMFEKANVGLSDYSLAGRQKWVKDNAEYLKAQGWDDVRINGYKGSAVDNRALLQLMQGKSAWDVQQPGYHTGRVNQRTGVTNSGWRGMSDDQLLNYKGSLFDLSDEELARQRDLKSGQQKAIVNGTVRNGDEVYDNGVWHDIDDMSYVQGKTLKGVAPAATLPKQNFSFQRQPIQYNPLLMRAKDGGKLNYANYL